MSTSSKNRNRPPSASSRNSTTSQNSTKGPAAGNAAPRPTTNAWSRPLQQNRISGSFNRSGTSKSPSGVTAGAPPGLTKSSNPYSSASPLHNNLRDRFLHLNQSLVGQRVTASLTSGDVLEGIFHVSTPFQAGNNRMKYVIKACKYIKSSEPKEEGRTLIVNVEDVRDMVVKSIRLEGAAQKNTNGLVTDTDISTRAANGASNGNGIRGKDKVDDLVAAGSAWMSGSTENGMGSLASRAEASKSGSSSGLKGSIGQWDQFSENEKLFSVKASFDEDVYTTSLDKKSLDASQIEKAERMAKEIEGAVSSNIHIAEERGHKIESDFDEEDLYSGVLRKDGKIKISVNSSASNGVWGKKGAIVEAEKKKKEVEKKEAPPVKKNYAAVAAAAVNNLPITKNTKTKIVTSKVSTENSSEKIEKSSDAVDDKAESKIEKSDKDKSSIIKAEKEKKNIALKESDTTKKETGNDGANKDIKPSSGSKDSSTDTESNKEKKEEKEKPKKTVSKLNAKAKSFSFNPSAKSFTPGASMTSSSSTPQQQPQQQQQVVMQSTGMEEGYPGGMVGYPPHQQHYVPHMPSGMMPMMPSGGMRYPAPGPYPTYPMQHQHHPLPQPPKQSQPPTQENSVAPDRSSTSTPTEPSTEKSKPAASVPSQNVQQQAAQHHYGVPGYYSTPGTHNAQAQPSMMHRGAPHMSTGYPAHQHHNIPQQYPVPGATSGPHYRMYQPHMSQQSMSQQMHPGGYYNQMNVSAAGGNQGVNGMHGYGSYNMGRMGHGDDGEQSFRGGRGRGGGGRGRKNGRKGGRGGNGGRGGYQHNGNNQGSQNQQQQQVVVAASASNEDNTNKQEKEKVVAEKNGEGDADVGEN